MADKALRDVVVVRLNIQVIDDSATGFKADDRVVEEFALTPSVPLSRKRARGSLECGSEASAQC